MNNSIKWNQVWEDKSREDVPDFELDRGITPRDQEIETLSEQELIEFIQPDLSETLLDAGCGTGVNILRLHSRVRNVIGIDYTAGSLDRCRKRIQANRIENVQVCQSSVTDIPLPDRSVNKVVCLSVLQYLDDGEVRQAFKEFARVLGPGGILVLHVKNASSLYWTSLGVAKKLKSLLGRAATAYHVRPFRWYVNELESLNCRVLGYKSFNLLTLDRMPRKLTYFLQGAELRHHGGWLFRIPFVRRHGADLKIRAAVLDCHAGHSETTSISPQALGPNR